MRASSPGSVALDCRDIAAPRRRRLATKLPQLTGSMIAGLREFVSECGRAGVSKERVTRNRRLLCRSAVGLEEDQRLVPLRGKPRLVFTSHRTPVFTSYTIGGNTAVARRRRRRTGSRAFGWSLRVVLHRRQPDPDGRSALLRDDSSGLHVSSSRDSSGWLFRPTCRLCGCG